MSNDEAGTKRSHDEAATEDSKSRKKAKKLQADIPLSAHYHISWMHATVVTCVAVSRKHGYIVTGDDKGVVKFWKRGKVQLPPPDTATKDVQHPCLEFVKAFTAHNSSVQCVEIDTIGDSCVSVSIDDNTCMLKFYEVSTFDAVSMLRIAIPDEESSITDSSSVCCTWFTAIDNQKYVAVAIGKVIYVASPETVVQKLSLHAAMITCIEYLPQHDCILSADQAGTLDLWDCRGSLVASDENVEEQAFGTTTLQVGGPLCGSARHHIQYSSKTETDLYLLQRKTTYAVAIAVSRTHYAIYAADHKLRLFEHASGNCVVTYGEGIDAYEAIYTKYDIDSMEFGKRAATEREIRQESNVFQSRGQRFNLQFDDSGRYLLIPSLLGIKVLDTKRHKLVGVVGKADAGSLRFVCCALASGAAVVDTQMLLARGGATTSRDEDASSSSSSKKVTDALLIALAYNQRRLYVFSHIDPVKENNDDALDIRDVWNEAPTTTDQLYSARGKVAKEESTVTKAILRTTMGDIHLQLFPQVPKTIENFVGHCKSGYYDNVIFHRVISGFMLQTGDPLGDGTGGESIWGGEFEDEIVPGLRHDRPFTVSMANAGPNTNGSQFFITTVPTPWLDGKHTVFGRVVRGMDVCTEIEKVRTDKSDKPYQEIRIQNVDLE